MDIGGVAGLLGVPCRVSVRSQRMGRGSACGPVIGGVVVVSYISPDSEAGVRVKERGELNSN